MWGFLVKLANSRALTAGIFFLLLGGAGFLMPNSLWNENFQDTIYQNLTIPELSDLCNSGLGQLAKMFSSGIQQACTEYKLMSYAIIGSGIIGLILLIIGAVISKSSKQKTLTCSYCNYVAISETDLLEHSSINHLDKSPYKCEHCDFIGITEEILWNHYNDNHPDEKKWKWN